MKYSRNDEILYDQQPFNSDSIGGEPDLFFRSDGPRTVHWSIAWSDLMMTMFIMFLVMFVFHSAKTETALGRGDPAVAEGAAEHVSTFARGEDNPRDSRSTESSLTVHADTVSDIDNMVLASDKAVRIILPGDLLFDTGMAEIKNAARESLQGIARIIRRTPYIVNVIGHTDNVPIHSAKYATNWELSVARACAVARFLIEDMRIPRRRFYVTGHSSNLPVTSNRTDAGKAQNRRVEIVITKDLPGSVRWQTDNSTEYRPFSDTGLPLHSTL
jgi:chemotaxis protein MotB